MLFNDRDQKWFLAQLKPNCVNIAEKNLKRQGFQTFLPLEEVTCQRKGKFANVVRPLFPGYIFVRFDVTRGLWRTINSTKGVTRLVSFGKHPTAVPDDLVTELIVRCDPKGRPLPQKFLAPGDRMRITDGPFANIVVEIEKIEPERRIWVLMEIMGGKTRVAINEGQLRVA